MSTSFQELVAGGGRTAAKSEFAPKREIEELPNYDSPLLGGLKLTGFEDATVKRLMQAQHILKETNCVSYRPLLPLLLSIKGEPYTLDKYFPFEPFFRTRMPRRTLYKTGRQVAKSTGLASRGIVHSNCVPWFSTLYIAPLFEQIRRFSQNYVRPFIDNSPVRSLLVSSKTVNQMLQRTFLNNSQMLFSFAFMNADRTRGISANKNAYDEVQDLDKDFIPVIRETMSGSKYGDIEEFAGTPKGLENTLQGLWGDSSQAEWAMKCLKCGYWNIPALTHDLEDMIGPYFEDISEKRPGVVCAKCKKRESIFPQLGRWVHGRPELRWQFAGYHIPQIIMPMHYGKHEKWSMLLAKRLGKYNTPINVFWNEVMGESYDTGSRIITMTDLKRAATLPWTKSLDDIAAKCDLNDYTLRVLSADWGGGGEDGTSYTKLAVLGIKPDGQIDVIWGCHSLTPHDHIREARLCLGAISRFNCHLMAHDYTGAGSLRETFIVQAGFPLERIINVAYVRAHAVSRIMTHKPATKNNPRPYFQVDKARSLLLTCNQIKTQQLKFFQWDYEDSDNTGLIYDFLALVDEKVDSRIGKDVYTIIRDPNMSDDFAQAVNIGCCTIWHATERWPDVAAVAAFQASKDALDAMDPEEVTEENWEEALPYYLNEATKAAIAPPNRDPLTDV